MSAYLFILSLEVLFEIIKDNTDIRRTAIFNDAFPYAACAIFYNYLLSVKNIINTFKVFSLFSGLKPNLGECEIAGLGSLKGVFVAVCGFKSSNLTTDTIDILGVYFLYNGTLSTKQFSRYSQKHTTSASFFEQQNALFRRKNNSL